MVDIEIKSVAGEAGVIASLIHHPEFVFFSENLLPQHFADRQNAYLYQALNNLAQRGVETIDAYAIVSSLESEEATKRYAAEVRVEDLQELIEMSDTIARHTPEEYKMAADLVFKAALRRDVLKRLRQCETLCLRENEQDLEQKIYAALDDVMTEFSTANEIPPYSEMVDECWNIIQERQKAGYAGIPFKFSALSDYATIERGELFIFGAEQKQGKSMMLLNCAIDLLKQDYAVLYIDSELNTRLFTARVLSHLSGVEYKRLTSGNYTKEEEQKILRAKDWMKTRKFTHIYIPTFDQETIYTAVKKVSHTQGLDVLIIDYFKGSGDGDAFDSYQELGRFVDLVKNRLAGGMNIAAIGAAQATVGGRLADSAKIARNASTIAMITDKSPEEIEADGPECGNKKLRVVVNRNGPQMLPDEYIDLIFDGNHISYEQAKQHIPQAPF